MWKVLDNFLFLNYLYRVEWFYARFILQMKYVIKV
jgi:hypothetical protein